jgi:hypothetical protein
MRRARANPFGRGDRAIACLSWTCAPAAAWAGTKPQLWPAARTCPRPTVAPPGREEPRLTGTASTALNWSHAHSANPAAYWLLVRRGRPDLSAKQFAVACSPGQTPSRGRDRPRQQVPRRALRHAVGFERRARPSSRRTPDESFPPTRGPAQTGRKVSAGNGCQPPTAPGAHRNTEKHNEETAYLGRKRLMGRLFLPDDDPRARPEEFSRSRSRLRRQRPARSIGRGVHRSA